jgi:glycosyltransferase involved in cell wall biosynthesis
MQSHPQVSVILSVYNQAHWAASTLASAVAQELDVPFEIIVCDDGSSDGILETIGQFTAHSPIDIRYIWQPDKGYRLSRSRNNGIRCAQGRILVFVDGDTWLTPGFLNDHLRAHETPGSLVCGLRSTVVLPALPANSTVEISEDVLKKPQPEHLKQQQWLTTDRPWMACLGGNFSVPNIPEVRFDEKFESWGSEDRDLAYRLYRAGLQPRLLPRPNALQLRLTGEHWSDMPHDQVVGLLWNKVYLAEKYPNGEMEPSLSLVRHCHLNAGRWSIGPFREDVSVLEVFDTFKRWHEESLARTATLGAKIPEEPNASPAS